MYVTEESRHTHERIKFSLCLINYYVRKIYEGVEV
jgi:hypothetical protein